MLVPLRHDAPKEALRFRMHEAVVVLEWDFLERQVTGLKHHEKLRGSDVYSGYITWWGRGKTAGKFIIENKHFEKNAYLVLVSEKPESKRLPILTQHKL